MVVSGAGAGEKRRKAKKERDAVRETQRGLHGRDGIFVCVNGASQVGLRDIPIYAHMRIHQHTAQTQIQAYVYIYVCIMSLATVCLYITCAHG